MSINLKDYFAWQDYPKKNKLLQKTKPKNEREYNKQLRTYTLMQQQLEEFRDRRRRINDILSLDKLIRGVKTKVQVDIDKRVRKGKKDD